MYLKKTPEHRLSISSNDQDTNNIYIYNSPIKKRKSFDNIKKEEAPFIDSFILLNRVNNIDNALLMDEHKTAYDITNRTIIQLMNPGITSIKKEYFNKIKNEFKFLQINLYWLTQKYKNDDLDCNYINVMENIKNLQKILQMI